jgi:hypothetical protein
MNIVVIEHEGDGDAVYCWGVRQATKTIQSCLRVHPEQSISVSTIEMTEKEYDALDDYTGEC